MPSTGFFSGSSPSAKTCRDEKRKFTLVVIPQAELWRIIVCGKGKGDPGAAKSVESMPKNSLRENRGLAPTWLTVGWALVFFFEVVSRPQREENRLLRLLQERDMACARRLTPASVRAATCKNTRASQGQDRIKGEKTIWPHVTSQGWKGFH